MTQSSKQHIVNCWYTQEGGWPHSTHSFPTMRWAIYSGDSCRCFTKHLSVGVFLHLTRLYWDVASTTQMHVDERPSLTRANFHLPGNISSWIFSLTLLKWHEMAQEFLLLLLSKAQQNTQFLFFSGTTERWRRQAEFHDRYLAWFSESWKYFMQVEKCHLEITWISKYSAPNYNTQM